MELDQELKTYESHRYELLGRAKGKYVLIKKDRVLGEFESQQDAFHRGYEEFWNEPFLVKRIVEELRIRMIGAEPDIEDRHPGYLY